MTRAIKQIKSAPLLALPEMTAADIVALKAVKDGTADPDQQKRCFYWLIEKACAIGALSFYPDSDRATSFAEGRRSVGLNLLHIVTTPTAKLTGKDNG